MKKWKKFRSFLSRVWEWTVYFGGPVEKWYDGHMPLPCGGHCRLEMWRRAGSRIVRADRQLLRAHPEYLVDVLRQLSERGLTLLVKKEEW